MVTRNHNNRSEKQKDHVPVHEGAHSARSYEGHQGSETMRDRSGTDERHDGKSRQNGGGDGAGGAPKKQGQGQANKDVDNHHQSRNHS
jgi:hypothetical protein